MRSICCDRCSAVFEDDAGDDDEDAFDDDENPGRGDSLGGNAGADRGPALGDMQDPSEMVVSSVRSIALGGAGRSEAMNDAADDLATGLLRLRGGPAKSKVGESGGESSVPPSSV